MLPTRAFVISGGGGPAQLNGRCRISARRLMTISEIGMSGPHGERGGSGQISNIRFCRRSTVAVSAKARSINSSRTTRTRGVSTWVTGSSSNRQMSRIDHNAPRNCAPSQRHSDGRRAAIVWSSRSSITAADCTISSGGCLAKSRGRVILALAAPGRLGGRLTRETGSDARLPGPGAFAHPRASRRTGGGRP